MNSAEQEIEVKFYLRDLAALERRLKAAGGQLTRARQHETNLRFDLPDHSLAAGQRVLRLRQDDRAVVTYKGPAQAGAEVAVRQEIEFVVDDYQAARRFFEALGYQVVVMYEKYRTTYRLPGLEVVLDELPFGHFCEIEGGSGEAIHAAAESFGLAWEARIRESYLALFERLKARRGLNARHLSFADLQGIEVNAGDLGVEYGQP